MTLGQMLAWHRSHCTSCTTTRACSEYDDITREFTEARQLYAGSTAPRRILSIREGHAS
jgi:hypothetical protein